jgi:hypothetical protein
MMEQIETKTIPAYSFVQYNDDEDICAFFDAANEISQEYLTAFNNLALPCWTSPSITGYLLDWIANGIYGQIRPALELSREQTQKGDYNSIEYDLIAYARISNFIAGQYYYASDDLFKRILTWNFYKGDGFQFSIPWLKRRLARFIHGKNGVDPKLQNTFDISVTSQNGVYYIRLPDYGDGVSKSLASAIKQNFVKLPFIYTYEILMVKL